MNMLKKAILLIRECVEVYIPVISFLVLFCVFVFQVFMRYVMRNPQSWTTEVEATAFLWLVLLGACMAQRTKSHVTFTLFYDNLGVKGKAVTAFLGNLIILITFVLCLKPTWDFVLFQSTAQQLTSILKISKSIVYFPYMLFLIIILIYTLIDLFEDFMVLTGLGGDKYVRKLLNDTKSEVELAIEAAENESPLNELNGKEDGNNG